MNSNFNINYYVDQFKKAKVRLYDYVYEQVIDVDLHSS